MLTALLFIIGFACLMTYSVERLIKANNRLKARNDSLARQINTNTQKIQTLRYDLRVNQNLVTDLTWQLDASSGMLETALNALPDDHMLNFRERDKIERKTRVSHELMMVETRFDRLFKQYTDVENERSEEFLDRFEIHDTPDEEVRIPVTASGPVPEQRQPAGNGEAYFKETG